MRHLVEARPHVIGHAYVLDHLVDLEILQNGERIFLRPDLAGLERVIDEVC